MKPPDLTAELFCPYADCQWSHVQSLAMAVSIAAPNSRSRQRLAAAMASASIVQLQDRVRETEDAIRAHLDTDHPGWTVEQLEVEAEVYAIRERMASRRDLGRDDRILEGEIV